MRGSLDATEVGVVPGALDDQSRTFQPHAGQRRRNATCRCILPAGPYVDFQPQPAAQRALERRARCHAA
jgi:hypothetical protein